MDLPPPHLLSQLPPSPIFTAKRSTGTSSPSKAEEDHELLTHNFGSHKFGSQEFHRLSNSDEFPVAAGTDVQVDGLFDQFADCFAPIDDSNCGTKQSSSSIIRGNKRRRKKPKDKPKRPLSAYNIFFKDERVRLLASLEGSYDQSYMTSESHAYRQALHVDGFGFRKLDDVHDDNDDDSFLDLNQEELENLVGLSPSLNEDAEIDSTKCGGAVASNVAAPSQTLFGNLSHRHEQCTSSHTSNVSFNCNKKNPHGKISFENLAKVIGGRWKKLSPEQVEHYKKLADIDAERYRDEMEEYERKRRCRQSSLDNMSNKSFRSYKGMEKSINDASNNEFVSADMDKFERLGYNLKGSSSSDKIFGNNKAQNVTAQSQNSSCLTFENKSAARVHHETMIDSSKHEYSIPKFQKLMNPNYTHIDLNAQLSLLSYPLGLTQHNPAMMVNPLNFHPNLMMSMNQYTDMANMQEVVQNNGQKAYKMLDKDGNEKLFHLEYVAMPVPYDYMMAHQPNQTNMG